MIDYHNDYHNILIIIIIILCHELMIQLKASRGKNKTLIFIMLTLQSIYCSINVQYL